MTDRRFPTAQTYIDWAKSHGCTVSVQMMATDERMLQEIVISSPCGVTALELVTQLSDPLASTTVARLDRRLGMKSHLFR